VRFLAAEDNAADAMAEMSAMEPESWNEIDDLIQAWALLIHDAGWYLDRLTDMAEDCRPLHPGVTDRMRHYAGSVRQLADDVRAMQDFSMVGPRAW
jgi:hypothetical protein